jgi:uncharacterized membrane protein YsdA (DUF1294 family)
MKAVRDRSRSLAATAILFLALIRGLAVREVLPPGIVVLYVGASLATMAAYWADKSAAQRGEWRTAESTLHALALIGGWPGALIGQSVFRHKSRKRSFRLIFLATVILNCGALLLYWWRNT